MKTKSLSILIVFALLVNNNHLFGVGEFYNNSDEQLVVKESYLEVEKNTISRVFELTSSSEDVFYMQIWCKGVDLDTNKIKKLKYDILVNGEKQKSKLSPEQLNWHSFAFKDSKGEMIPIKLLSGKNKVVFSCNAPETPEIEMVSFTTNDKQDNFLNNSQKYNSYLTELKSNHLPENWKDLKEAIKKQEELDTKLKSSVLDNPAGNYEHLLEVDHGYTYYKSYYFTSGQNVKFHTVSNNADPIMYLYRSTSSLLTPGSNSWFNDDGMYYSLDSKIEVSIPQTGYYTVLLASYNQNSSGITDLYKDDVLVGNDVPVGGVQIACSLNKTGNLNFFTSEVEFGYEDTYMIVSENNYGPAKAFNDNYSESSSFPWYTASRIKGNFTNRIRKVLITSNHSTSAGTCDVYMNCENSNLSSWFPNLKPEDAIQSAPASGVYNCISWSGGITNYWEWPLDVFSDYYIPNDPLGSFDNFYETERYPDAMTYTRSGVNYSNICVDLWAKDGNYTHGSVRKPGNSHPHGYDWESKPGGLMRTFHPRHSLNGSIYGSVVDYYRPVSNLKSSMLLDESIARGLSVIENVELSASEKLAVSESITKLPLEAKSILQEKYEAWKETWENSDVKIHSDPRRYADNKEYYNFIEYCKKLGRKSWPFIFDKFEHDDFFVINALEDLTLEENLDLLEKIKSENNLKSSTASGAAIVRSPQSNAMKYIKELLKSTGTVTSTGDEGIVYSNSFDFSVYPNPATISSQIAFNLPYDAKVSVEVIDLTGKVLSVPLQNQYLINGDYNYQLNVPESFRGTCLVKLRFNNNVNVQLLVVE